MSNSPLVNYIRISPNSNNPRNNKIRKITIHHMAGNLSVKTCGNVFANGGRQASSNYGVDSKGNVGMYVEEKNRSWCSSSPSNDHQAITIEVANDGGANTNWHVSDKALAKLIDLCVDICKRNPDIKRKDGKQGLYYDGTKNGSLTRHNMFAATTCPGPYLQSKFDYIVEQVNKRLDAELYSTPAPTQPVQPTPVTPTTGRFNIGDKVIVNGNLYVNSNAASPAGHVTNKTTTITRYAAGAKHPYNTTGDLGWMNESDITLVGSSQSLSKTYTVVKGDTLSGIAKKLGISDWHTLYNNNKSVIGNNPNLIKPGQVLKY